MSSEDTLITHSLFHHSWTTSTTNECVLMIKITHYIIHPHSISKIVQSWLLFISAGCVCLAAIPGGMLIISAVGFKFKLKLNSTRPAPPPVEPLSRSRFLNNLKSGQGWLIMRRDGTAGGMVDGWQWQLKSGIMKTYWNSVSTIQCHIILIKFPAIREPRIALHIIGLANRRNVGYLWWYFN